MTNPTIISEKPLTMYDVKKELKVIKKRDETLGIRSMRCEEYVNQFTSLSDKASAELKEKLLAIEIPRVKEEHINKLVDILPMNSEDAKIILSGYGITVKAENLKKIDEVLAEYNATKK